MPERPSLDGLEDRWAQRWEAAGTYSFDRSRPRVEVFAIDSPPLDGQRLAARRSRPLLHAHRPGRALPADARPQRLLPDGLGRQRAAHRAPGAAGLRGPLRADPAVRPGLRATVHSGPEAAGAGQPAGFRRAVRAAGGADEAAFERCGGGSGLSVDWTLAYSTIDERSRRTAQLAFLRNLARGEAYRADGADAVGRGLRHRGGAGGAGGPRGGRRLARARLRLRRRTAVHVDTTRPELLPACVALVAHPDDERYAALVGTTVRDAGVRRRGAGVRAPAGRPGQGHRAGDGVHLRRPDRRHLVARARAADPRGDGPGRPASAAAASGRRSAAAPYARAGRADRACRARRADRRAAAGGRRAASASRGRCGTR